MLRSETSTANPRLPVPSCSQRSPHSGREMKRRVTLFVFHVQHIASLRFSDHFHHCIHSFVPVVLNREVESGLALHCRVLHAIRTAPHHLSDRIHLPLDGRHMKRSLTLSTALEPAQPPVNSKNAPHDLRLAGRCSLVKRGKTVIVQLVDEVRFSGVGASERIQRAFLYKARVIKHPRFHFFG